MIRIALQAKGRLNDDSLLLFRDAGIAVDETSRRLLCRSRNFPVEILYLRDDDIPQAVAQGIADAGIVGLNEVRERGVVVDTLYETGFGICHLSLAIPREQIFDGLSYFQGKKVATSYPNILKNFFIEKGISCIIEPIAGSVEIAPSIGMTDAIFDIVSSGSTLLSNGLKEVERVLDAQAILIGYPGMEEEKRELINQLVFRFQSVQRSRGKKYVLFNIPTTSIASVVQILPGMKSPTLLPLAQEGWSAVHAVMDQEDLWEKIGRLKELGAEDILVLALEKMIL